MRKLNRVKNNAAWTSSLKSKLSSSGLFLYLKIPEFAFTCTRYLAVVSFHAMIE
jgi:hypothetical protein